MHDGINVAIPSMHNDEATALSRVKVEPNWLIGFPVVRLGHPILFPIIFIREAALGEGLDFPRDDAFPPQQKRLSSRGRLGRGAANVSR
jgi:hypothetical protein